MNYNIEYLLRYVSNDTYKKILKNKDGCPVKIQESYKIRETCMTADLPSTPYIY